MLSEPTEGRNETTDKVRLWKSTGLLDGDMLLMNRKELGRAEVFHALSWYVATNQKSEEPQTRPRQSDQPILAMEQGNACRAKGLTEKPMVERNFLCIQRQEQKEGKRIFANDPFDREWGGFFEEPCAGNLHAGICGERGEVIPPLTRQKPIISEADAVHGGGRQNRMRAAKGEALTALTESETAAWDQEDSLGTWETRSVTQLFELRSDKP